MMKLDWTLTTALTLATACALASAPRGANSALLQGQAQVVGYRCVDLDGRVHHLGSGAEARPLALVFLDVGCPIARRYAPRLVELAAEAAGAGVDFYGVLSDPELSPAAARAHRDEYALSFPVLLDSAGDLAARLAPTHVPEAFVVDRDDRVVYRGRIDDRFEAVGRMRASIGSHDLLDALRATAAGKAPVLARTEPVGCVFEAWGGASERAPTYAREIAPILDANCVGCHRSGDVAPFSLQSHAEAARRAKMIAVVTRAGNMPPWFAEPGHGDFRDERGLSPRQIDLLARWAEAGAPEGDPAERLPAPKLSDDRWRLGPPDLLVEMPVDFEVPASGDDIYRYFVVPSELTETREIVAIDFRPGDPSVVHHCIVYIDRTGAARRIDAKSERPGFSVRGELADSEGESFDPNGLNTIDQVAGWAPGTQPYVLPPDTGIPLEPGGDFVLEVHYHLTGKATTDRSALALYFADKPVARHAVGLVIGTENIDIEAGEPDYWRHVWMEVPTDVDLIDVSPHMHYLGKSVEVTATLADGDEQPLIRIEDWDFRWQGAYFYRRPVLLPAGSRIDAYFRFDNSAENPFNPSSPPIRVREGWRTTDEMCLFYFTVVPHDRSGTEGLYGAMFQSFARSGEPE